MAHRNRTHHTSTPTQNTPKTVATNQPTPAVSQAEQTPPAEQTPAPVEPKGDSKVIIEASVSEDLRKVLETVPKDSKAWAVINAQLEKLEAEENASEGEKKRVAFDTDLKAGLTALLEGENGLLTKHGIDLSHRKVIILFPNGTDTKEAFTYSNIDINAGKAKRAGGGGGGFKENWLPNGKKAEYSEENTVTAFESPSALAKHLGLRVTGHKDMPQVFTKPISLATNTEITETKYSVDAVRGDHFIVTKQA